MTKTEAKIQICQAAAVLTAACVDTRNVQTQRLMDGKLSPEEKLENLEVWETFKVFAAGIAASLKEEHQATLGFEVLDEVLAPTSPTPISPEGEIPNPGPEGAS